MLSSASSVPRFRFPVVGGMSVVVGSGIEGDGVGALCLRGMTISFSRVMGFWSSEVGALHGFGQYFDRGHACEGVGLTLQEPRRSTQG